MPVCLCEHMRVWVLVWVGVSLDGFGSEVVCQWVRVWDLVGGCV